MIWVVLALQLVGLAGVGYAVWNLYKAQDHRRDLCAALGHVGEDVRRIGAHRPVTPTEKLIRYWTVQMNSYEPGSAKHRAYRNQLLACGEVDGDRHEGEAGERPGVYVRPDASAA